MLANDKDFEGDALHISAINGQAIAVGGTVVLGDGSSVTLNANQTLTFNPNSAFQSLNGGEQAHEIFTYTVTDSQGASSAPTSVDVTVNGAWEAPTFFVNGEVDEKGQKPATEDVINGSGIFLQRTIRSSVQMMPGSNSGCRSTTEMDRLFSRRTETVTPMG